MVHEGGIFHPGSPLGGVMTVMDLPCSQERVRNEAKIKEFQTGKGSGFFLKPGGRSEIDWYFFQRHPKTLFEKCGYLYSGFFLRVHNVLAQKPSFSFSAAQLFFVQSLKTDDKSVLVWDFSFETSSLIRGPCKIFQTPKKKQHQNTNPKKINNTTTLATTISYIPFLCVLSVKSHLFLDCGTKTPDLDSSISTLQERKDAVEEFLKQHAFTDVQTPKRVQEQRPCKWGKLQGAMKGAKIPQDSPSF